MVSKGIPGGPVAKRQAYFDEYRDYVETPIYERSSLVPAQRLEGPAIIEQADTTTVVYPEQAVEVDRFGNLILTSIKSGR